jgi:hypothetical protein
LHEVLRRPEEARARVLAELLAMRADLARVDRVAAAVQD